MGSDAYIQLPVIDFSMLSYNQNPEATDHLLHWDSMKTLVLESLQKYGCFQASMDGVPPELHKSVYGAMKNLFDLPLEMKAKNVSTHMFNGYIGNSTPLPLYESMGIDEPCDYQEVENFINLMLPQGNPQVCNDIHIYSKKLTEMERMVKKMVFESFDLGKHLNEHMELTRYVLKLMKYRAPEPNETNLGLHAHADSGIMTVLHQNEVEGLEIQMEDEEEWLKVKLSPNSFIVMAGETLRVWLNGRLHAPLHRVVLKGNTNRFSLALFALPKTGYTLKAIEEMVDEEHPLLFKPFDYEDFMKFLFTSRRPIDKFAVKVYCGLVY
ncbi:probable 2-oxoglutarate-dependent dioxygenase AOP1 [Cynara cardunculus var. scolymus]|uniref:probable 2-oxoglutarate-dependent dioxygenase AOP1 n=1 Tax=Cynara cardunculus var. scolymus TaxID=59895 RepID=UPI000D62EDDE|nr:probable 2-oxoglutarate-dependent dioxygenase AOP1 [Cynara cardunculus var. scolymus]